MRLSLYQEKFILLALCAPLFAGAHIFNGWLFQHVSLSNHISWIYLPAFLRMAYVLVLGSVWGFVTIFTGSMLLSGGIDENLMQNLTNASASSLGPVLALWLFRVMKERPLHISSLGDLVQMCILYAMLNALVHHAVWSYSQPDLLVAISQMPIMVIGDLAGALIGSVLFTVLMRQLGLYKLISRLSQDTPPSDKQN